MQNRTPLSKVSARRQKVSRNVGTGGTSSRRYLQHDAFQSAGNGKVGIGEENPGSPADLNRIWKSGSAVEIEWPEMDFDISFESLFMFSGKFAAQLDVKWKMFRHFHQPFWVKSNSSRPVPSQQLDWNRGLARVLLPFLGQILPLWILHRLKISALFRTWRNCYSGTREISKAKGPVTTFELLHNRNYQYPSKMAEKSKM